MQENQRKNNNFLKIFIKLIHESSPRKYLFFLLIAAFILIPLSITLFGSLIKHFIDHAFINNVEKGYDLSNLNHYIFYFIILASTLAISSGVRIFAINYLNDSLIFKIKEKIFSKMLNLNLATYDQFGKNFFKTLLGFDIEEVIASINLKISIILRNLGLFFGSIVLLFLNNAKLSLIIIFSILVVLFFISILGIKLKKSIKKIKNMKNNLFLYLDENISFIKYIKSSNQIENQVKKLKNSHEEILKNTFYLYIFRGFFIGFIIFSLFLTIILTIYIGSLMILKHEMTPGLLSSFIFYALIASTSLGGMIESFFEITKHKVNLEKIEDIVFSENEKLQNSNQTEIDQFKKLEFKNVFFKYKKEDDEFILNNLNFTLNAGEKIAIIGSSGSGKSSILNLILKFYKVNSGNILVNDTDLNEINSISYYKMISVLNQDVEIFSTTLYENITYGLSEDQIDQELLLSLIEKFNLKDFISSLKNGIQTLISDGDGMKISGGQKQRIALIRALLRKPQLLILDESTAALDMENEAYIYNLLLSPQYANLSIIFITHKLSFLEKMNKIIDLKKNGGINTIKENNLSSQID